MLIFKPEHDYDEHVYFHWLFPNKGYADPPPPTRSGRIFMKDAECAEENEKSILRFLFFQLS